MDDKTHCPCEAVKELQKIVTEHEKRISGTSTSIAVIITKINIILGIISAVGVAVLGVLIKLLFRA